MTGFVIYLNSPQNFVIISKTTTNDELEDMIESGNPAIFTQGVSGVNVIPFHLEV